MNRRAFLKALGLGTAGALVLPELVIGAEAQRRYWALGQIPARPRFTDTELLAFWDSIPERRDNIVRVTGFGAGGRVLYTDSFVMNRPLRWPLILTLPPDPLVLRGHEPPGFSRLTGDWPDEED